MIFQKDFIRRNRKEYRSQLYEETEPIDVQIKTSNIDLSDLEEGDKNKSDKDRINAINNSFSYGGI